MCSVLTNASAMYYVNPLGPIKYLKQLLKISIPWWIEKRCLELKVAELKNEYKPYYVNTHWKELLLTYPYFLIHPCPFPVAGVCPG